MFAFFTWESLWIGTNESKFSEIKNILDRNNISYKYKRKNQLSGGRRGVRGRWGGAGYRQDEMFQYEIFVGKENLEKAQHLTGL